MILKSPITILAEFLHERYAGEKCPVFYYLSYLPICIHYQFSDRPRVSRNIFASRGIQGGLRKRSKNLRKYGTHS